jgi:hypothetical protein
MREMAAKDEDVAFYHQHKDDDDVWGTASQRDQPRRRETLTATITVRFSAEEAAAIRRLSQAKRMSYSDVVRDAVRNYTQPAFSVEVGVFTASFARPTFQSRRPVVELGGNLLDVQNSRRGLAMAK